MSRELFVQARQLPLIAQFFRHASTLNIRERSASSIIKQDMPPCSHEAPVYEGPSYDDVLNIKQKNLTPNIVSHFKKPLLINSGHMQWLYDHTGRRYLDMFGGIVTVSVGHCHPKVNEALEKQLKTLWHTTNIYMHPKIHEYAQRLVAKLPGDLKAVCFVNSGSEANDLAMLLARMHTGNQDILALRNGYHGMSPYTMGLTAQSTWRFPLPGIGTHITHVMNPDPYQGLWGGANCRDSPVKVMRDCECAAGECIASDNYYQQLEETFKYSLPRGRVAGMFAESIQGVGGTVQFTKNYIKRAAKLVRANGGLFISDEVQTGFGRTGEHYWGFEAHGIIPDIVTMAKGIGNGFPLAAVITTPDIAKCLGAALHFNTYGGNPLASAVGVAVLDVIEEDNLQKNSHNVGTYLLKCLEELQQRHDIIGDVRGKGLMVGMELVGDRAMKTPLSTQHVADIWETCKDMGVLFGRGGLYGNIVDLHPPLCIRLEDVDYAIAVLEKAFETHTNKKERSWKRNIQV